MSENSDEFSNDASNRLCGGGNPIVRAGVLRPSVLGSTVNHSNKASPAAALFDGKEKEQQPTAFNPFLKAAKEADAEEEPVGSTTNAEKSDEQQDSKKTEQDDEEPDERPDPMSLLRKNGMERANLFAAAKSSMPRVESSGFVFGQNVHERVVGETAKPDSSSTTEKADSTSGELLFSSVIQNATKATAESEDGHDSNAAAASSTSNAGGTSTQDNEVKSLTDVAREYEESRAQKRKFEEVKTFTGEENEVNIVDISCKLFAFVNSNWEERGRGSLRLNDSKTERGTSRVVFRTSGNLRLLLNTKVWAGMVAERPSQKSLRLTAMDNTGKIKVYLAQARPVEINQLHKALVQRIDLRKATHPEEGQVVVEKYGNGENANKNGAEPSSSTTTTADIEKATDLDKSKSDDENDNEDDDDDKNDKSGEPSPKKAVEAAEASN